MRLIHGFAILLLFGCGTVTSTKFDLPVASRAATFDLRDERPSEERLGRKSKEAYSEITFLADDGLSPPGPLLLKSWLGQKLSDRIGGKQIVLTKFLVSVSDPVTSINEQAYSNAMASTPGVNVFSGLLARWTIGGIESARSSKTVGVRIEAKIGDQAFSGIATGSFAGRVSESNVNSIIMQALEETVKDLTRLLDADGQAATKSTLEAERTNRP